MRKRLTRKAPVLQQYKYTLNNPVSGLKDFSRIIYATDKAAAMKRAKEIARCFGKNTVLEEVVKIK